MASIKTFSNYKVRHRRDRPVMANNADWLDTLSTSAAARCRPALRSTHADHGFGEAAPRRDQPLSFLEFNYMILRSYDFVELYKRHNCIVQMGGSDQWGNIVMGADLGRAWVPSCSRSPRRCWRQLGQRWAKLAGAVWPTDRPQPLRVLAVLAQHRNADVGRFLRTFTDCRSTRSPSRGLEGAGDQRSQEILATEITALSRQESGRADRRDHTPHLRGRHQDPTCCPLSTCRARLAAGISTFELLRTGPA
jgi:tyrosyl-tRNA synthetase